MPTHSRSKRIDWVDAAKGTCILLVVLYHTTFFIFGAGALTDTLGYKIWVVGVTALTPLRMPLFFMISGFLAYSSVFSRSWQQTFRPRIATMLWLYLLWMAAYWGFGNLISEYGNPAVIPDSDPLPTTISGFIWKAFSGSSGLWYLYALAIYFVICKALREMAIPTLIAFALAEAFTGIMKDVWHASSLIENGVFFAFGCFGRNFIMRHFSEFHAKRFFLLAIVAVVPMPIVAKYDLLTVPGVKLLLAFAIVFAAIDLFALLTTYLNLRLLCAVGRQTLPIYVMHMFFVLTSALIIIPLELEGVAAELLAFIGPPLLTLMNAILCLALHALLNRRLGKALFTFPSRSFLFRTAY
ncbi:acyltransferase family protein [Phytohalomonas tamaricis]|uniref:acyltransferase family protein n=1 Tax=Phytohalomonas tamaricis TaxID=2081032 RepID=UPI000D0ABFE1|nr:acyltransferase family protein [Phytohalomonas tamaricis]